MHAMKPRWRASQVGILLTHSIGVCFAPVCPLAGVAVLLFMVLSARMSAYILQEQE